MSSEGVMKVGDVAFARELVSDHAVVRFLERAWDVDVDLIRHQIAVATAHGRDAAALQGFENFDVAVGRVRFVLKEGRIVTALVDERTGVPRLNRRCFR
ncbi:hypothetical protein [Hansschlegelia zhihuaiae]|uniref:DUF4258 domain-containing protein n=1 Tax=Hansschlegelia zhihuaiae TaxID=405005 RepID=A0A4Q0MMR4_9HYPH|nr:hypothetical protein [Hansschlegelia zhihuaiae]RXF75060.1 hypothetical protein EK403_03155 [Hansschlegelia zhihuaiae]